MSMHNLKALTAQKTGQPQNSKNAARRIDACAHVDMDYADRCSGKPLKKRTFMAKAAQGYVVAARIETPRQFDGLGFRASEQERIEQEKYAATIYGVCPGAGRRLPFRIHLLRIRRGNISCLRHRRNLFKIWVMV